MNFFLQIHRSIVDPSFYKEIATSPRKRSIFFLVKLLAFTVFILATTYTWRVADPVHGLSAVLPAVFPRMQISQDGMIPHADTPYLVSPLAIEDLLRLFSNSSRSLFEIRDSAVVVDSRRDIGIDKNSSIMFLLAADVIHVKLNPELSFTLPYSLFVSKDEVITFTKEGIAAYIRKRLVSLFINFYIQHCIVFTANIVISLFFLSFAAFIFRTSSIKRFRVYLKLAAFAITPIALETILVNLAGVSIMWLWHISIFISVFILYRGISYITAHSGSAPLGES